MTDREKIIEVIAPYVSAYGEDEAIANALIAAGFGNVADWKRRAEVAEREFSKLVHEMYEHDIRPMCDEKFFVESRLKDAEKELTEEKDE